MKIWKRRYEEDVIDVCLLDITLHTCHLPVRFKDTSCENQDGRSVILHTFQSAFSV